MSDGALIALALSISIAGMASLALSIETHWRHVVRSKGLSDTTRRRLRLGGAILLAIAFVPCAAADPLSMAALVWPMLLTVAAVIVATSLTLRSHLF